MGIHALNDAQHLEQSPRQALSLCKHEQAHTSDTNEDTTSSEQPNHCASAAPLVEEALVGIDEQRAQRMLQIGWPSLCRHELTNMKHKVSNLVASDPRHLSDARETQRIPARRRRRKHSLHPWLAAR